jgi:hypothetical protein
MQEVVEVTRVLNVPTWELVYSEVFPEATTYRGPWVWRRVDFSSPQPFVPEELVAKAMPIVGEHAVPLYCHLWRAGEEGTRWLVEIAMFPRPDVYGSVYPQFWPAFLGGIAAGLFGIGAINTIFGKGGGGDGGGGVWDMTAMMAAMMPMMMLMMMMSMMTSTMSSMKVE